jgi:hypothetical protein
MSDEKKNQKPILSNYKNPKIFVKFQSLKILYRKKLTWMHMTAKIVKIPIFFLFLLLLVMIPVNATADPNVISQGNTVFIGEQGLNVASAVGTDAKIGWWASGAAISTSAPDQTVTVSDPTSFFVTPSSFASYTGNWYRLNGAGQVNGIAFNVQDPHLAIRVEDTTLSLDRTNDWFPTGDQARFAIDSNLDTVSNQRGEGAPVTIYVQAPDGGQYSALYGPGGISHPIDNVIINSNPFYSDSAGITWDTGNSAYSQGTYIIWIECNLNHMKDNYQLVGKTVSQKVTILDQDVNPLIRSKTPTTTPPTPKPTSIATTKPIITVITTVPTTQPVSSSVVTPVPATQTSTPAATETQSAMPSPSTTKAPGFAFIIAISGAIIAIGLHSKKE